MQLRRRSRCLLALPLLALPALAARGQGFGLNEISTCGIGRAYAAVATGCHDASTIYWNPAAATSLNGWNVLVGAAAIIVDGSFKQDTTFRKFDSDIPTAVVPHGFINYHDSSSSLAYGLGAYVPYGLTSQWFTNFPGRFIAQKASLQTIYIQPNVAWQINKNWSIGGGPILGHSSVELIQAVDLSQQTVTGQTFTFAAIGIPLRTQFATAKLDGGAWAWGAQVGVQGHLSPHWSFGARYLTQMVFNYDNADATFTQVNTGLILGGPLPPLIPAGTPVDVLVAPAFGTGGPLVAQKVSTSITHPAQFQVGFNYTGFANWEIEADYAFVGYKGFKSINIDFSNPATPDRTLIEDYNNSSAIRLGAEYRFKNDIRLRGGFAGVTSPAPDVTVTPLLPDQNRANYTLGASIPIMRHWTFDAGYAFVATPGRRGRIDERASESQTATQLNTGVYKLTANIFALGIKASF